MNKEKLDALWKQVEHIGKIEQLEYDAMVTLGSVFGEMSSEIKRLNELLEGNDGMSVKEIKLQFIDLHRDWLKERTTSEYQSE